jgi:hypothetical protein
MKKENIFIILFGFVPVIIFIVLMIIGHGELP